MQPIHIHIVVSKEYTKSFSYKVIYIKDRTILLLFITMKSRHLEHFHNIKELIRSNKLL